MTRFTGRLEESTSAAVALYFKLIGWRVATEGDKARPFAKSSTSLGVTFRLERFSSGEVNIENTPDRRKELQSTIEQILHDGKMSQNLAQRLRGKMFAENQMFGRRAKTALQSVTEHVMLCQQDLNFLADLQLGRPRLLKQYSRETFVIFTDASYDKDIFASRRYRMLSSEPCRQNT